MTQKTRGSVQSGVVALRLSSWAPSILALLKPLGVALLGAVASLLAYVLTPLNEFVNALIWKEKAEILLIAHPPEVREGDIVSLDVVVQPLSPVAISPGTLEIRYSNSILRPGAESVTRLIVITDKLNASKRMHAEALQFIADAQGDGQISASLRTQNGSTFSTILPVLVARRNAQRYPTRQSFSGQWNIDVGNIHGQMELKDVARTLNGEYKLSDGNYGQIEGTRDGKTFRVALYRGASPSRYFVEGSFDPNPNVDLEITGVAKLLLPVSNANNPWREERQVEFHAVARQE